MKANWLILLVVAGVGATTLAGAQSPAFYHLSTAEGLSDNNVSMAVRDRHGILWIATTEGLNSFDGNRITTYHKHRYPELADNNIERIVIDSENRIWLRANSHYVTMLDAKRKFHRFLVGDSTGDTHVTAIFHSKTQGVIALKGRQHYYQKKGTTGVFEKRDHGFDSLLKGTIGFTYYLDHDKVIYYRGGAIVVIDYGQARSLLHLPIRGINGANMINHDELLTFSAKGDKFHRIRISEGKIVRTYTAIKDQYGLPVTGNLRNMTMIDSNRFAFTTYFSGLYLLDLQQQSMRHWVHDPIDPRSIGGNNTFNIRYDSSGYLFVTTQTSGVHFFNMKQQQASTRPYFIDAKKQVFDGYIQSLTTDESGNLWMGAQDRLIRWNSVTDKTDYIPLVLPGGTDLSGQETIRVVSRDEEGNTWVGTSRYGLLILDKNLRLTRRITDSADGKRTNLPSNWINAIGTDMHGDRWVTTLRGTCIIRKKDYSIVSLKDHPLLDELSHTPGASLWNDGQGRMWIGSVRGAWAFDQQKNTVQRYTTKEGLAHNIVYAVQYDRLGNTYFATAGGFSILDASGTISSYNRSNGLRNDRCEAILRDEHDFLWIGNLNCILRYDPRNKKFAVYEEGIGFSHSGFRVRSAHKSKKGEMFWGTDRGITFFYPQQMSGVALPLHPLVNTLEAGDAVFHFPGEERIKFPYTASSFVFHFSSGELEGDKKNQLLYRLQGFDKDWKTPAGVGHAVYSKLPPGNYTFEVKASRDAVTWYQAPYPVNIVVQPPWWRQTWFRVLYSALVAGLSWFIYDYWRRRRKNKMEMMLLNVKMAESKFLNLRLQMNPHFLFNALSSIQHLIVSRQTNKAYKYLTYFSNFLRSLLNYAEKHFLPLDEEKNILRLYIELESLRFDQSFSWEIVTDEQLSNDEIFVPTLMIQPFVENAIWHGLVHKEGEKRLVIRFQHRSEEHLVCIIEDNGIGREEAARIKAANISSRIHTSKGIGIIRERLALLGQKTGKPASLDIEDLTSPEGHTGTRVIIAIPYYNPEAS